jgi:hypothetical protein
LVVYYDGYGYNFYYDTYGYYEYSVHPEYEGGGGGYGTGSGGGGGSEGGVRPIQILWIILIVLALICCAVLFGYCEARHKNKVRQEK